MKLVKELLKHLRTMQITVDEIATCEPQNTTWFTESSIPDDLKKVHTACAQIGSCLTGTYHEPQFTYFTEQTGHLFLIPDFTKKPQPIYRIQERLKSFIFDTSILQENLDKDQTFSFLEASVPEASKTLEDYTAAMESETDDLFLLIIRHGGSYIHQDCYAARAPGDLRPFSTENLGICHVLFVQSKQGYSFFAHISARGSFTHSEKLKSTADLFIQQREASDDPCQAIIFYSENSHVHTRSDLPAGWTQVKIQCQQDGLSRLGLDLAIDSTSVVWRYSRTGIVYDTPLSELMKPSASRLITLRGTPTFRKHSDKSLPPAPAGAGAGGSAGPMTALAFAVPDTAADSALSPSPAD